MTPIESIGQFSPSLQCCAHGDDSGERHWYLKIPRLFPKPAFNIGDLALYRVLYGEYPGLYQIRVLGIHWSGIGWEYSVTIPVNHPKWHPSIEHNSWYLIEDDLTPI
jgi:hypothetical protein